MSTVEQNKQKVSSDIELKRSLLNKKPTVNLKHVHKWQYPHSQELTYKKQLDKIVDLIDKSLHDILIPQLPRLQRESNADRPIIKSDSIKTDSYIDDLNSIVKQMQLSITNKQNDPKMVAQTTGIDVSQFNRNQFGKVMQSAFGVDLLTSEPWLSGQLDLFTEQNISLIHDLSNKALQDLRGIVLRGFSAGTNLDKMTDDLLSRIPMTRNRAKLIARDQVSKLNGQLTDLRQTQNGISKYQWATAGDERVRPSHAEKEGNIYSWSNPPSDTGNPGEDINCRCTAIPILDDLI